MAPSSAAAAARLKLISVTSFGLIAGVCVFVGFYLLRRQKKSQNPTSTESKADESDIEILSDRQDGSESDHAKNDLDAINGSPASKELEDTLISDLQLLDSNNLYPEDQDFDEIQMQCADLKNTDSSDNERDRDLLRDEQADAKGLVSKTNDAQPKDSEKLKTNGKNTVFSTGLTHFLDETNAKSILESSKGNNRQQKQDTWSETVIVSGKECSANETEKAIHDPQITDRKADRNDSEQTAKHSETSDQSGLETENVAAAHEDKKEELPTNTQEGHTPTVKNGDKNDSRISGAAEERRIGGGGLRPTSLTQEAKLHADHGQQLLTAQETRSPKPPVSTPLTPPPGSGTARKQRKRGGQTTPIVSDKKPSSEGQSARSRQRWPPLDDKAVDNVELDAGSQLVSWTTSRSSGSQSSVQSPWTPTRVTDEIFGNQTEERVEFDDNFIDTVSSENGKRKSPSSSGSQLGAPEKSDTKDISSLLHATSPCVLERKPLLSDDEDDEDATDHRPTDQSQKKVKQTVEDTTPEPALSKSTEEETKLIKIDENCVDSLIKLTKENQDPAVQLASLRALVNLSWTTEKHQDYVPVIDQLFTDVDGQDGGLKLEALRVLANLSKNPNMVPYLLAAKAPGCLLRLLSPDLDDEMLTIWLSVLDDVLWTSKEMCLTYASLPTDRRAASPDTVYTGLYGLKNSRILKSRIFVLSRHRNQQVTYLASRIYSCLTS